MNVHLRGVPPLKGPLQREQNASDRLQQIPASAVGGHSASNENQFNNALSSSILFSPNINFSASKQPPPPRNVLRNLETMETFFRCHSTSPPEYLAMCRKIADSHSRLSLEEEARLWCKILETQTQQVALETQQQSDQTEWQNPGAELLRLHRRATSRFTNVSSVLNDSETSKPFQRDLLHIFMSFAQAQLIYGTVKDARQTLKYLQNEPFGAAEAAVYLALARVDGEDPDAVLRLGIQKKAEPIQDLYNALRALQPSPKRRKIVDFEHQSRFQCRDEVAMDENETASSSPQKNTSQLSQDSNMSLDESEEEDVTEKLPKKAIRSELPPTRSIASGMTPLFASTDIVAPAEKARPPARTNNSTASPNKTAYERRQKIIHKPLAPSSLRPPSDRRSSIGKSAKRSNLPPRLFRTEVGKAERVDPSQHSILESDSDNDETSDEVIGSKITAANATRGDATETAVNTISKNDIDYMLNWKPNRSPAMATQNDSSRSESGPKSVAVDGLCKINESSSSASSTTVTASTSIKETPVKKLTKNDLAYMLKWEPKRSTATPATLTSSSIKASPTKPTADDIPKLAVPSLSRLSSNGTEDNPGTVTNNKCNDYPEENSTLIVDNAREFQSSNGRRHQSIDGAAASATLDAQRNDLLMKRARLSQRACTDFLPLINENNVMRVNGEPFLKLGVIGKGGSCKVYRALSKTNAVVAIKKVKLEGLEERAIDGYSNEIALLKRLRGNPSIIQLYDSEVDYSRKAIFLVMEPGEADLNQVLQQQALMAEESGSHRLDINFIRLTWLQMLKAVHSIHEERIIHGDLKPANFLFVRGSLKLIDFGIAKAIASDDTTNIYRESQIGTLNYMSPEAILDDSNGVGHGGHRMKCGRPSDIWSLGCILYQMIYGTTPFAHLTMVFTKCRAIVNPDHEISFPGDVDEAALDVMKQCLQRDPKARPPIVGCNGLLDEHRFLHGPSRK